MLTDIMEIYSQGVGRLISEKRCGGYMPLNCVTMRPEGLFIVEKQWKPLNIQKPNPRRWKGKSLWAPLGLVGTPNSTVRNLVILSPFGTYNTSLEIYLRVIQDFPNIFSYSYGHVSNLKKRRLGGQNYSRSSGLEKLLQKLRT